jgi:hypothetical protein
MRTFHKRPTRKSSACFRAFLDSSTRLPDTRTRRARRARRECIVLPIVLGTLTSFKIVKETASAKGATLTVDGVDADKGKSTGTIDVVKENGAWKIGNESWTSK